MLVCGVCRVCVWEGAHAGSVCTYRYIRVCVVAVYLVLTDTLQTMLPLQGLAAQWARGSARERATHKPVAITAAANRISALLQVPFPFFLLLFLLFPLSVFLFLLLFFTVLTLQQKHDRKEYLYVHILQVQHRNMKYFVKECACTWYNKWYNTNHHPSIL